MEQDKSTFDVIVIGGGASGMMAAGRVASLGGRVLLLEKNERLGKKLSISGGGRCNITNAEEDIRELLKNYGDGANFLFSPFSQFSNKDTFTFFEDRGLPLVTQARNRVFPHTEDAEDVVTVMENYVRNGKAEIHLRTKVKNIVKENDVFVVTTKKDKVFTGKYLIVATGGLAAPQTGSTGEGFDFLSSLGHTVLEPNPNIVPLTTDAEWVHKLSGVSLSYMRISFLQNGKTEIKKVGKVLFTHFGVSGPLILNSAHEVKQLLQKGAVSASIDMFPETNEGELDRRVWNLFERNKNKLVKNVFHEILPKNMVLAVLGLEHINLLEREVNSVTKEERKTLVKTMKNLAFKITGTLGFEKAVIADGGVVPEEVDFKTMESRIMPGLFLLGDTIDINRPSGGFSLQLAWTTGFVAGSYIGKKIHE